MLLGVCVAPMPAVCQLLTEVPVTTEDEVLAATRRWLEAAACRNPAKLLDNHAMFPEVLDNDAMQVALVSAKLIRAG